MHNLLQLHLARRPSGHLRVVFHVCPTGRRPQSRCRTRWRDYISHPLGLGTPSHPPRGAGGGSWEEGGLYAYGAAPTTQTQISGSWWMVCNLQEEDHRCGSVYVDDEGTCQSFQQYFCFLARFWFSIFLMGLFIIIIIIIIFKCRISRDLFFKFYS